MKRVLLLLASVACGSNGGFSPSDAGSHGDADGVQDAVANDGPPFSVDGSFDAGTGTCSDASKLVYLVSVENDLWTFDPAALVFTKVGALDCPTTPCGATWSPEAMAVDRNGTAYIAMTDGRIFTADTATAHCSATSYVTGQNGRRVFDMAFATDGMTTSETLYTVTDELVETITCSDAGPQTDVSGSSQGGGLATIGIPSLAMSLVGDYTDGLAGQTCALTGTGDGRLFGWFGGGGSSDPSVIAEIDKTTGATPSSTPINGVATGGDFAWSFWGGDFWFYSANGASSSVTRFRYSTDQSVSVVVADTGMLIVGAGVSTCAPVVPVN
jgi:hypothetical protein